MQHKQATIRKAAILISSLEEDLVARLLDELSPSQARLVQRAARVLGPIDPQEQEAVIQEFLRIGPMVPPSQSSGIELDGQLAQRFSISRASQSSDDYSSQPEFAGSETYGPESLRRAANPSSATEETPFQILTDADGRRLAHHLRNERPQTIAVVLSYLPQDQAARLLSALPTDIQVETIQRLVDLDETDQESLRAVEQQLADWVNTQRRQQQRRSAGVSAVRGILSNLGAQDEQAVMDRLTQRNNSLAASISRKTTPESATYSFPNFAAGIPESRRSATLPSAFEMSPDIRRQPLPTPETTAQPQRELRQAEPTVSAMSWDELTRRQSDIWEDLLNKAEPELIVLALAGAPSELVNRVLHGLPPHDAEELSKQLTSLGPTRLSDVEAAQAELASLASKQFANKESDPSTGQRLLVEVG